jgi:hypothetical protein
MRVLSLRQPRRELSSVIGDRRLVVRIKNFGRRRAPQRRARSSAAIVQVHRCSRRALALWVAVEILFCEQSRGLEFLGSSVFVFVGVFS